MTIPSPTPADLARDAAIDHEHAESSLANRISDCGQNMPPWLWRESFHRDCEKISLAWIRRAVAAEQRAAAAEARVVEIEAVDKRMCLDYLKMATELSDEHQIRIAAEAEVAEVRAINGELMDDRSRLEAEVARLRAALDAERKAYAKIAEDVRDSSNRDGGPYEVGRANGACRILERIRAYIANEEPRP